MGEIIRAIKYLSECGLSQTRENIIKIAGRCANAKIDQMVSNQYLTVHNGEYYPTVDAIEWLDNAPLYATQEDYDEWYTEVMTGFDKKGNQTEMVNPAVPSWQRQASDSDEYETLIDCLIDAEDEVLEISDRTGIDPGEIWARRQDGLVGLCYSCGVTSVFHSRSGGEGPRSACVECEKEKRNEREKKRKTA